MTSVAVADFERWRDLARALFGRGVPPEQILWVDERSTQSSLPFAGDSVDDLPAPPKPHVPRRFVELAELAACHRDAHVWPRLYRVLWRIQHENRRLLDVASDEDVHALEQMASQVGRDEHKMRAFVRFTPVQVASGDDERDAAGNDVAGESVDADERTMRESDARGSQGGKRYVAWYQPDHLIVRRAAPFFADRFSSMRWSILTPDLAVHWDLEALTFTAGVPAPPKVDDGEIAALWRTYYATIFNPARANLRATLREMPMRRWAGLPEASLIPSLLSTAHERTLTLDRTRHASPARLFVPDTENLTELRAASTACRGCDLHARATQVVFGEGPREARLVLVGEQPGDAEDRQGRPFVGPAGGVLDRALAAAGVDRSTVYVTNAVKHFSFEERGKRRIHQTPKTSEVLACRPWLEAELRSLRPAVVVCLGATAARSLLGPQTRVMQARGRLIPNTAWAPSVFVTVHPSAVLRADDGERYFEMLVQDLTLAAAAA
jgi:DNA polymerase